MSESEKSSGAMTETMKKEILDLGIDSYLNGKRDGQSLCKNAINSLIDGGEKLGAPAEATLDSIKKFMAIMSE